MIINLVLKLAEINEIFLSDLVCDGRGKYCGAQTLQDAFQIHMDSMNILNVNWTAIKNACWFYWLYHIDQTINDLIDLIPFVWLSRYVHLLFFRNISIALKWLHATRGYIVGSQQANHRKP